MISYVAEHVAKQEIITVSKASSLYNKRYDTDPNGTANIVSISTENTTDTRHLQTISRFPRQSFYYYYNNSAQSSSVSGDEMEEDALFEPYINNF
ncbi:hypothetical protein VTP01DRAFT_3601 [Rhizomucor pusillus]|uniref:uncharacterized protein n=1 Tax=Rhizomucor pusillus TaxID=4840 RepID=UPI0037423CD9